MEKERGEDGALGERDVRAVFGATKIVGDRRGGVIWNRFEAQGVDIDGMVYDCDIGSNV